MFIIEPSEILAWNGKLLFTDVNYAVILDLTNSSYNFPCKNCPLGYNFYKEINVR